MGRRVVLVLVLLLATWGLAVPATAAPPPRTFEELVERLRQDPVQVNTMMGLGATEQVDAALTDLAGRAPVPVYVVLDLLPQDLEQSDYDPRTAERLAVLLSAELGPGLYVLSLGETAESIIGHREVQVFGVDQQVLSDFYSGTSHFHDITDYTGAEPLRVYLGLRAVVEGGDAVEAIDRDELGRVAPWAFPGSLEDHLDALTLRTGATVGVPLALGGLLLGAAAHLRRARRRAGL
ncbi:hypothetical protein, partial [Desertihabitans aurantiacus]|uniref:hypothetical protein n=1 Tax=Desertihabitans aurantiacus TaxID=2282477 RepID=UPI001300B80C